MSKKLENRKSKENEKISMDDWMYAKNITMKSRLKTTLVVYGVFFAVIVGICLIAQIVQFI